MKLTWTLLLLTLAARAGGVASAETWTLERALAHAREHNPDVMMARGRIAAAQAAFAQANAAFWPRLQFQSSYTRTDNPMLAFGSILNQKSFSDTLNFNDVPDTDDLNARGLVTVPIYAGGRNAANNKAAEASALATKEDEKALQNALGFEVARSFFTVTKTREFIRASEGAVTALQTNLSVANRRLQAGSLLKTDVLDMQVRLAQAHEDLLRAQNANAIATRALRNLLGVEDAEFVVADSIPEVRVPAALDFSGRPELAAARERERAAEQQVRAARGGYLPRLSAFGSLDYDYGWEQDNGGGSYTVGGLLQWDIWDGNSTRARIQEARAGLDTSREAIRKTRLMLDLEVEQARLDLNAARERIRVTEQMSVHAAESAELTRARFDQGEALSAQVVDSETALMGARVRNVEAKADYHIALAALRKALGMPQIDSKPDQVNK